MKYTPSIQDYAEIAKTLDRIRNELIDIDIRVTNTFGKKYDLRKTHETVDKIRSLLEDKMYVDFPDDASVHIFYPRDKDE